MKVLVTGATGFLGRHLLDLLLERGDDVRAFQRSYDPQLEELGIEIVEGDLTDREDVRRALDGVDAVYHLAGRVERDPARAHEMYALHVEGTRHLLDAARELGTGRIVVASTSGTVAVSEDPDWVADDEVPHADHVVRNWPYYLSKIYAERVCFEHVDRHGMDVVLMRPTLLLGPGDWRESSTGDVIAFLRGQVPFSMPGGLSFVDVRDTAEAFVAAMDRGKAGATYLLGASNMTLDAFFEELAGLAGLPAPRGHVPRSAARIGAFFAEAAARAAGKTPHVDRASVDMAHHFWYVDWSRAASDLGFSPRDPRRTLRDTVRWIRRHHPEFATVRPEPPSEFVTH